MQSLSTIAPEVTCLHFCRRDNQEGSSVAYRTARWESFSLRD